MPALRDPGKEGAKKEAAAPAAAAAAKPKAGGFGGFGAKIAEARQKLPDFASMLKKQQRPGFVGASPPPPLGPGVGPTAKTHRRCDAHSADSPHAPPNTRAGPINTRRAGVVGDRGGQGDGLRGGGAPH